MNTRLKKVLLALTVLLLLGAAGAVVADTAIGSVTLEDAWMSADIVTCPVTADPTGTQTYEFKVSANLLLGDYGGPDGIVAIHLLFYHESVIDPLTEPTSENNIRVHFDSTGWWVEDGVAMLADHSLEEFADILGLLEYQGFVSLTYPANSLANQWRHRVIAEQSDGDMIFSAVAGFTMSSYLSATLLDSSWDFGTVALGAMAMPIQLVDGEARGYLEILISCNYEVVVTLGMTDFTKEGSVWVIYPHLFTQNSVDDYAGGVACVKYPDLQAPLQGQGPILGDSVVVRIYLWVNPTDASLEAGLWTGTLGVIVV